LQVLRPTTKNESVGVNEQIEIVQKSLRSFGNKIKKDTVLKNSIENNIGT
jgi:hypothetical protein